MTELARLQERLTQLRQAPNSAVSYKVFSAPSEHDYEVLRSLYAVKRDATTLGSRDSEQAFFSAYVETVSTLRETVLPATCKAYKINNGDICGAGLHGDTNDNIRHCGKHSARSAWVRGPLLFATGVTTPPLTTAPGGQCLDCGGVLGREPYGQCLVCERGFHLACLAEKLDPAQIFELDPYVFCVRCFTEAYDEVTAIRVLDPPRRVLILDSEEAWGDSENQDVFLNHALPALSAQHTIQVLDKPYAPPTPGGVTPFSAARARQAMVLATPPAGAREEVEAGMQTPGEVERGPPLELPAPLGVGRGGQQPVAEHQAAALMSAAREHPATADLREAVEQLQRQIQQLQDGGGEGLPNTPTGFLPQVDPTGADLGYKSGEIGAPNHRLLVESVLYLGVGATTKPQKREMLALINAENITDKQGCGFWPESGAESSQVVIGGEVLEVKKQSKGVPDQLVVQHYLAKLITRWLSIRSCGRDVFAPDHPEVFFFTQSASLILARLEFLKEMLYHLTNSGYSWPGVWRYLLLVWEGHMRPFGWLHKIRFDQSLMDAYRSPVPQLAMAQLASTSVLAPELLRSEAAAAAALQIERALPAESSSESTAKTPRTGPRPGEKCSLCSSSQHTYRSPDFVCVGPITRACPAMLTDGKVCGERHAHSGPLKTPCRGGLEQAGRQRPRGGDAGSRGAGTSGTARAP